MMRENVERVLQFMAAKRIRMHHVGSKEVIEGNLKAVMRLILALAAHYKPQSVRTSPYDSGATTEKTGTTASSAGTTATPATPSKSTPPTKTTTPTVTPTPSPSTSAASSAPSPSTSTATVTGSAGPASTPGTPSTPNKRSALSVCVTTPNLNVPGNRKSIGHLLEGTLAVAPLRRFPSVAGHQWAAAGVGGDDGDDGGDEATPESRVDDDAPAAARPVERRGRRQWGLPGPPLYENLPRSNSFASYSGDRPRLPPAADTEGIYDVPRCRPPRVQEGPASLGAELSRTTQTDGREPREIVDGFSSLPRHGVRPAALDFWESLTTHSTGTSSPNTSGEFRYNTIHRMSGRRLLPKTPDTRSRPAAPAAPPVPAGPPKPSEDAEERSLGSRGEVEGSSSHGSPTTSIVRSREEAVAEWLPYDALLEELGRARRQLVALQELVSLLNGHQQEGSDCRGTNTADEFVFLKSRLQNTSEKCNLLQADLNKAKQNILNESDGRIEDVKLGPRNAFGRHGFASEKGELGARLGAQDRELQELRRQLADKDKAIHLQQSQFDDAIKALANSNIRPAQNGKVAPQSPVSRQRGSGREEMQILRDAISSLRANFRESDPNHHTLDTLEQCVAVVLDRLAVAESGRQVEAPEAVPPNKRAPITSLQGQNSFTKVVYYTEKTLTPFLSSVPKQLGEITLRDFKQIFDRPGNYRFHFKSMDPEFGMVKEEISNDDEILPGFDGKLISWVVEDHGV
ncbi:dixin-like [Pollicipes pollicipes]|uniref:dixin-like n=1 Tax=Pollicipes pollicipes TaxID=41117 RepID=UPI001884CAD4|nr:dixin-like [Pollicipes pollicipes]